MAPIIHFPPVCQKMGAIALIWTWIFTLGNQPHGNIPVGQNSCRLITIGYWNSTDIDLLHEIRGPFDWLI
jgi:hypothetical protein